MTAKGGRGRDFGALHVGSQARPTPPGTRRGPALLAQRFTAPSVQAPASARARRAPQLQIPASLEGLGSVSVARNWNPHAFVQARAQLIAASEIWKTSGLPPHILFEHGRNVEVRLSFASERVGSGVVPFAGSRNEWQGTRVVRALVISEQFRGTPESHAVSLIELASFFERGATVIAYSTAPDNDVVAGRLARLGAREVPSRSRGYRKWELTRGEFEQARVRSLRTLEGAAELERAQPVRPVSTLQPPREPERLPYQPPQIEQSADLAPPRIDPLDPTEMTDDPTNPE